MAFKMKGSKFYGKGNSSPVKHGTTDDFLYGRNGHNPDTMEGKHEDWHTNKIEAEKKKPSSNKQKVKIKDNIGYDEQYDIYYDKDIQKSYEQRRGRFAPKKPKKNNQQNTDRLV